MYKHFGNIWEKLPVNNFLSPDFTKGRPYVFRILIRTARIAPTLFNLFHLLSGYAMRILILIRRCGTGPLCLILLFNVLYISKMHYERKMHPKKANKCKDFGFGYLNENSRLFSFYIQIPHVLLCLLESTVRIVFTLENTIHIFIFTKT